MPPPVKWLWDQRTKRYRSTDTGRFISAKQAISYRDQYTDTKIDSVGGLTDKLINRTVSLPEWESAMREEIKQTYIAEYLWGRGGRNNMTQRDWGILGQELREQYAYLSRFADQLAAGEITEAQARLRAKLYIEGSTQMFERAKSEGRGMRPLPQYPGDGNTQCLTNCRCHLEYEEEPNAWLVTWVIDPQAEHCPDCERLTEEWAPLVWAKG